MDRQHAYRLVQRYAHANGTPFRDAISDDDDVQARLSRAQLDKIFDPSEQLREVDATFRRLGLLPETDLLPAGQ
jgi:adenylosuccinate lyase